MRTKLDCHNCNGTFSVDFDDTLNGNHIVKCPNCGHEHCRVIKDGVVTGERWDSRNGRTYYTTGYSYTATYTSNYAPVNDDNSYYLWSDITSNTSVAY
jgi:NAD-dependent SIR2 family protein deacetylase